jgi:hypothetical protein
MFKAYELFGFMSPSLASEIVEQTFASNKELYRATLAAVAEARKVRPAFLNRKPRVQRHQDMVDMLSRPRMNLAAGGLIRGWLMEHEVEMLKAFLDALEIAHKEGAVEDLPASIPDDKLKSAIDRVLESHPPEKVTIYLHAFDEMNEVEWPNLKAILENDSRLQLGA